MSTDTGARECLMMLSELHKLLLDGKMITDMDTNEIERIFNCNYTDVPIAKQSVGGEYLITEEGISEIRIGGWLLIIVYDDDFRPVAVFEVCECIYPFVFNGMVILPQEDCILCYDKKNKEFVRRVIRDFI